jgi:hypothetical protein
MKFKFLIFVFGSAAFLIAHQITFSQKSDIRKTKFLAIHNLKRIENKDSINQIEQKIAFINNKSNRKNSKLFFFNHSRKWKLLFSVPTGYHENFPGQCKDTTSFTEFQLTQFQRLGKKSYLTPRNDGVALSGFKLFKIFGVSKFKFPINYYPQVYARDSRFNGEWTAILLNKEYLIIRYVSSYPDGNQSSWYREETYYFERN